MKKQIVLPVGLALVCTVGLFAPSASAYPSGQYGAVRARNLYPGDPYADYGFYSVNRYWRRGYYGIDNRYGRFGGYSYHLPSSYARYRFPYHAHHAHWGSYGYDVPYPYAVRMRPFPSDYNYAPQQVEPVASLRDRLESPPRSYQGTGWAQRMSRDEEPWGPSRHASAADRFDKGGASSIAAVPRRDPANFRFGQGDFVQAAGDLRAAIDAGSFTMGRLNLGDFRIQLGDLERRVYARSSDSGARLLLAYIYLAGGRTSSAVTQLNAILRLEPNNRYAETLLRAAGVYAR